MTDNDDVNILLNSNTAQGHSSKFWNFKLEPALMFMFFGYNLAQSIVPNQLLKDTCLMYGYNVSECSRLGANNDTKYIEEKIQPHVAEIMMINTLLNSIIPAVLSLFLGPWSDKFGRKKVFCATFIGFSLTLVALCIISMISDKLTVINPWVYTFAYIPLIITGGWPTMIVSILCYVTDLTTEVNRSVRLTLIELLIFVGVLFGTASSSYILTLTSPTTVFLISTIIVIISTIYSIVYVDESVQEVETTSKCNQIQELISYAPVIEMLKTCFKRRLFKERRILWCLIMILVFLIFSMNGSSGVFYLFVREQFQWTLKEATLFDSVTMLISIIGCTVGLVLFKNLLKLSDLTVAIIAIISGTIDTLVRAFAQTPNIMYISAVVCLFKVICLPMCRSMIASIIPTNEIGKVYSITSSFEAVSSLIASPLYTYIYTQTFTTFAGAFYLLTAGVYIVNFGLIICVMKMKKTREVLLNPYTPINS
ncbi:CLUMA_CG005459, isoform A [Clunio marinus]|uniref:CLUMA_CG005459, isoform A n=1 Tax=Clunio marinus TaxID=568069 RepID=A0A1J1HV07_9DIPT|nr:CLUMA_CG005459, isoform A [Clunio marinus]